MTLSLAVIGAGASTVALLCALRSDLSLEPMDITIFEPSAHLWRGRAYQPDADCVLVNSVPTDMSVDGSDHGHVEDWLAARRIFCGPMESFADPVSQSVFMPRPVYGDYLEQSARQALLDLARRGWSVRIERRSVKAIQRTDSHSLRVIADESGPEFLAFDRVVLATGAGRPTDVFGLRGVPGFIADPYPVADHLRRVDRMDTVAVIGTGLTAVDVALALRSQGHQGPIRLLSRSGALPGVRQRAVTLDLAHFTRETFARLRHEQGSLTLTDVVRVFRQELEHWGESDERLVDELARVQTEDGVSRLRRHLGEVEDSSLALRLAQRAIPEAGPDIWPYLPDAEQDLLLSSHYRTMMSICCPMPPQSARLLVDMIDGGQLTVESGLQLVGKAAPAPGFEVTVHGRSSVVDTVVSAVNARVRGYSPETAELVDSLVTDGLARRHRHGGLVTDRSTSRVSSPSGEESGLYTLGDPAAGSLFFTFGIESLVDRAIDIALDLSLLQRGDDLPTLAIHSPIHDRDPASRADRGALA
ncbi:FAD/NAD(P)-binding protein [Knoellia sp. CPCC 206453]|uniref:FAD/NAD(P)-binding protein n=1 Tax=Knoellia pratensis TaxID=3404796 RepID=UPI003612AEB8